MTLVPLVISKFVHRAFHKLICIFVWSSMDMKNVNHSKFKEADKIY